MRGINPAPTGKNDYIIRYPHLSIRNNKKIYIFTFLDTILSNLDVKYAQFKDKEFCLSIMDR